ncbi:hypothetical protein SUGI_0886610 [Cryptomeria japonica]|nr:hypothetical protein SUGI_0886610 [Cryptomeria japonica]
MSTMAYLASSPTTHMTPIWRPRGKEERCELHDRDILLWRKQVVMHSQNFWDFYTCSFQYYLIEDGQKYLDIESVCCFLSFFYKINYPSFDIYDSSDA